MKNILVTGYAAHELGIFSEKHQAIKYIRKATVRKLTQLIEQGAEWFISPGQYGFDLWAIEAAMKLRDTQYPHIAVSVIHAFNNQTESWNETKKQYWNKLQSNLDHFDVVSKRPYEGPWQFQARDQLMLQKTNGMLLFFDAEAAESKVRYIEEKAKEKVNQNKYDIVRISSDDINSIVEEEQLEHYSDVDVD